MPEMTLTMDDTNPRTAATAAMYGIEPLYYPGATGYVFAASRLSSRVQLPFYGMIVMAADNDLVTLHTGGRTYRQRAMALWARDVVFDATSGFITVGINPLHPRFRAIAALPAPHVLPLDAAHLQIFLS